PNLDEFTGTVLPTDATKEEVRTALFSLATDPADQQRKVRASASYVVSKIAAADFPEDWPRLLPSLLSIITSPSSSDPQLRGVLVVLHDLISTCAEDQFLPVARDVIGAVHAVATDAARKPALRALAVGVFKTCFEPLEIVLDEHRAEVRGFVEGVLGAWAPFMMGVLREEIGGVPTEEEEAAGGEAYEVFRGTIALKLQVVKTFMRVRAVFPALLVPVSAELFGVVWGELRGNLAGYTGMYVLDERQGRLEDSEGLPYTLDFLVLELLDFMQSLIKAPPVRAELQAQLAGAADVSSGSWLPEVLRLVVEYAQITTEEEGLWDIDVNLFLSEETSVTANYTPRSCAADLVLRLGEWLKRDVVTSLLHVLNTVFADEAASWKVKEAALFILNQLLRDLADAEKAIPAQLAAGFTPFLDACLAPAQDQPFLRSRGFLVAAAIARAAASDAAYHPQATATFEATAAAITADTTDIVPVACLRALQDFLQALPAEITLPRQVPVISTIASYLETHDLTAMLDADELKYVLVEVLRDAIVVDPAAALTTNALHVLFAVASSDAENFQLGMVVTETFEEVVSFAAERGVQTFVGLCETVVPSLSGAIDGAATGPGKEMDLAVLAADLLRCLAENGTQPLPDGFVASTLPKLTHLLLSDTASEALLPPATLALKFTLAHDPAQYLSYTLPDGKSALESTLLVIDRLLNSRLVDDGPAAEVGGLAAELVDKAGVDSLGPYFPQLLSAVAHRLALAQQPQIIQSLILVFARLCLVSAGEVVSFLADLQMGDAGSALDTVLPKWLENSASFAGYDEIRQNVMALARIYALNDPRVARVMVKGDLIVQDTGRIKTRSQARLNPDRYTLVPAPVKIVKVLVEELASAAGGNFSDARALASAGAGELESEDEDDEWEDVNEGAGTGGVVDLNLGVTKQSLMGYLADTGSASSRGADDETLAFLKGFYGE
ncbi:hypothetical protein KEM55_003052, partial [Ascosphaera atra]